MKAEPLAQRTQANATDVVLHSQREISVQQCDRYTVRSESHLHAPPPIPRPPTTSLLYQLFPVRAHGSTLRVDASWADGLRLVGARRCRRIQAGGARVGLVSHCLETLAGRLPSRGPQAAPRAPTALGMAAAGRTGRRV